jgi:hypothetical protein
MSLGTTQISALMKEAREKAGLPPARRGRTLELPETRLESLVAELRTMGVKNLAITDDDFTAEMIVRGRKQPATNGSS